MGGHEAIVELLVKRNAKVTLRDKVGCTPLHLAELSGYKAVIELLLKNCTNVNVTKGRTHWTLFHLVAPNGIETIIEQLLETGASVNPGGLDKFSEISLDLALKHVVEDGYKVVVKLLLE